ncbi:MAG: hypothetical protein ACETWO_01830 [Candidatus Hadarchaeaceae archaeon]
MKFLKVFGDIKKSNFNLLVSARIYVRSLWVEVGYKRKNVEG